MCFRISKAERQNLLVVSTTLWKMISIIPLYAKAFTWTTSIIFTILHELSRMLHSSVVGIHPASQIWDLIHVIHSPCKHRNVSHCYNSILGPIARIPNIHWIETKMQLNYHHYWSKAIIYYRGKYSTVEFPLYVRREKNNLKTNSK